MTDPLAWIDDEADAGRPRPDPAPDPHGAARPAGSVGRRELVNFGSNDYLGLAADPRLAAAARAAAEAFGWGAGASPLVSGWTDAHQELADALAEFERAEAVAALPDRLRGQPRDDRRAGRAGRRGLRRPPEPRLPDRRRPALGGEPAGLPAQRRRPPRRDPRAATAAGSAAR